MICVFDVIEGPARGKRFWMRQDQQLEIGRLSTADFSIPDDHHLSRHHLIVEAPVNSFRVRDVGSANGTFVNNAKVSAIELRSGDIIRAGSSAFEVSFVSDDESPHACDGLELGNRLTNQKVAVTSNGSVSVVAPQAVSLKNLPTEVSPLESDAEGTERLYSNSLSESISKSTSRSKSVSLVSGVERHANGLPPSSWWLEYFSPTKVSRVFRETEDVGNHELDLASLLQALDIKFRISIVLNVSQLGRIALEVVDQWRKLSRVLELSPKLCLLTSDGSDEFWTLVRNSLRHEALIVFGSHAPLEFGWLQHLSDLLWSPTTLNELLNRSTQRLRDELLEQSEFVIFEQDSSGKLGLLVRED
jgi:pSer/pThr/pTyr-binding forkhead associated (FHA) protein